MSGVGVDDTRMDLSQFDETGRSLATSQPVLDLTDVAESSDFDAHGESMPKYVVHFFGTHGN